jgi:nitric oxide reductase subunit B
MVGSLLVAGFAQAFIERAVGGSTLQAFMAGQGSDWFVEGMYGRFIFGLVFAAGFVALAYDFLTAGRRVPAIAAEAPAE